MRSALGYPTVRARHVGVKMIISTLLQSIGESSNNVEPELTNTYSYQRDKCG